MHYPDYACQCCGVTNNDMFYDRDVEITEKDKLEFEAYSKVWHLLKEQQAKENNIQPSVFPRTRIGKRHTQETREKISATIRAKQKGATNA